MAYNRMQFMQWMKNFHTRQRQLEAKATRSQMARRVIVVRKRAPPVVVPRPAVTEQSIQCDLPIVLPPEPPKTAVTVGTQWTRQKQTVTKAKRKPAKTRSTGTQISSKISTDLQPAAGKTSSNATTATTRKGPMRQTKLHSYAEGGKDRPQRQPAPPRRQQQQRKCSPKLPVKEVSPPVPSTSKNPPAKKKSPSPKQGAAKNSKNSKQSKEPSPEIHVAETPSDTEVEEKKHFPYRTQPRYPSVCSKSTETSFLTPTKVRDIVPEPSDGMREQQPRHQTQLVSPMERMYVGPVEPPLSRTIERPNYGPFLVPLGTTGEEETISPTPPNIMYVNRPERRMLVRSTVPTASNNTNVRGTGLVREKYPEVSIISSQQLYSQIGLAVEKALKNKTIPPLESMYGKPFIEVFNGVDSALEDNDSEEDKRVTDDRRAGLVCSSANNDRGQQQANRTVAPPFHNDRSPSLSPIVYRDDDSADDFF
ncbi:hypothetical protein ZHAS_00016144 [Anopheles sinensis]|uniref:Uncharacterized protein n=1 Tax=Anopheles sinensis TaxID=74873 RepID=A0A084WCT2_ANOSI|nr:hypothetical protein ZHAS_00016144 [Anopheles sinensis]